MSNCNLNGQTFVNTVIPAAGGTEGSTTYAVDLTHYLCGNRKVCINAAFPLTANLDAKLIGSPIDLGNEIFYAPILISGTVTYMPYRCGNRCMCGNQCPVTDNIWTVINVPVASVESITAIIGKVDVTPTNVKDCCNVTNALSIITSMVVKSVVTATRKPKKED